MTRWYGYNKYGNKKVYVNNIKFDSKHEAEIYLNLKMMERGKVITDLRRQVPFELQPSFKMNGKTVRAIKYIADFVFVNEKGETEVWDAKGVQTEVYKIKKKLFEYKYGIEIKEV